MTANAMSIVKGFFTLKRKKMNSVFAVLTTSGVVVTFILMYFRAFLGTELSDEAYYIAEAKVILDGNIPYAYACGTQAIGFTFLLVVIESLYRLFVPDLAGIVLFTRLCFVTYKLIVWAVVFSVLRRKNQYTTAMIISALIIPLNGPILNFSYNTVPELTMFMVGCILYDTIEQDAPRKEMRLVISGFLTGIACFANPGWGVAFLVFLALIAVRVKSKKNKIISLLYYGGAVLADVLIVVISVSIAASFSDLCYGFYRMFIKSIPVESIAPDKTWSGTVNSFAQPFLQWVLIFVPVSLAAYFVSTELSRKKRKKWSKDQCLLFAITLPFFIHSIYLILTCTRNLSSSRGGEIRAFITFCYMIAFILAGAFKKNTIVWYLGVFQPLYAVAEIILVASDATIYRFINAYTIIVPMLYILISNKSKVIKALSGTLAAAVVISLVYANFKLIYRDSGFNTIRHNQVQSGVYKGLYTTEDRAKDFPQLEAYLNSVIDEDDRYAFRNNVPFSYLMVHKGTPCEQTTWDTLQYHHKRNSPAVLYDYYRVRDMIPDKIIYVDFGKDERLSINNPDFRYNDWVNAYYDLVEDIRLNETFFRVMVYQYNGKFDGNYQWWIQNYLNLAE